MSIEAVHTPYYKINGARFDEFTGKPVSFGTGLEAETYSLGATHPTGDAYIYTINNF